MALLTQREIQTVNITKSAILGRIYHGTDSITYQGQIDGTLLPYQPAVSSSFIPTPTNKEVTVQKAIENLGNIIGGSGLKEIRLIGGLINGTNKIFTWQYSPMIVELNGQMLRSGGVGYTLSGTVTTLINAPFVGDYLWAYGNY